MVILSTRSKEAIKTALAMTIAYGIALSMDWDRPYWAGFAVAFISLSTVGQSLNKGALRMMGTLLAFMVSLTIIALFAQERWWFMVALSAFFGFCTYMNGGSKHQYFWFVAGFATVIICFDGGTNPANAFDTAVLRAQETGLGILVYTLVTVLLWPSSTGAELDAAVRQLAATEHDLYRHIRALLEGQGDVEDTHSLRMQEVQQINRFSQALAAARTDSYEVWEVRGQWQRVESQSKELLVTLERWRESINEVQELDLNGLLPNLHTLGEEVDGRFEQTARMFEGETPERTPQVVDLALNKEAERALTHFQKAALTVTRNRLQHLEELTRSLFETIADIKGFAASSPQALVASTPQPGFVPDPDRIASSTRAMAGLWLAYLLWIYVEVPAGSAIVTAAAPIGMSLANMPQARVSMLFKPVATAIAFASALYIFVMPQLSSFAGLGPMIFLATFAICYLFATPRQALGRAFGLAMFVTIAGISNQQSYNFLSVADTSAMFVLLLAVLALAANIPHLARPEKAFLRLLARFFRSCENLMTTMRWNITMTPTRLDRWRQAFHAREVATLPQKLAAWGKALDTKDLPGTSADQVLALTTNLQALAYRMQELMDARTNPQAELLVREMLTDVRAWRLKVQEAFRGLSMDPAAAPADALRERLTARLALLERRIEETLNKAGEGELSDRDGENFYRLLGAYRGLSEAAIEYAGTAEKIDWSRWQESRF
jgi:uncharacterized membrane protein YccC